MLSNRLFFHIWDTFKYLNKTLRGDSAHQDKEKLCETKGTKRQSKAIDAIKL